MKRKREKRKKEAEVNRVLTSWREKDGLHAYVAGLPPRPEELEEKSRIFQENLRKHPNWKKIVEELGEEKAEELLKQCRVELRPI